MPYDCFVSYASPDVDLAKAVYEGLSKAGFKVWFDIERLEPGCNWYESIEQGCENSRVVLPVLTPRWRQSEWTRYETYGAEAVVPLLFGGAWEEVCTPPLERFQAEVLKPTTSSHAELMRELEASLRRLLAVPAPTKQLRVWRLKHRANACFVGRESELITIQEEFHTRPTAGLTPGRVRVVAGMGGLGKTTLARQYAEKFWRCYSAILWVDARSGLENEFAQLHDLLHPDRGAIGLSEKDKAASALHTLNDATTRLLVIDNAEDESSVKPWIPTVGGCHTLITSRFSGWSVDAPHVGLSTLDQDAAVEFLQRRAMNTAQGAPASRAPLGDAEREACSKVAEALGRLPLALEQAAAYISQQGDGYGFRDYLEEYDAATQELLDIRVLGSTDYPDSVIATWKPSVGKLKPLSRAMLRLCSYFAATPIPLEYFAPSLDVLREAAARSSESAADREEASGPAAKARHFVRSLANDLARYSLASIEGQNISFHPLLQMVEQLTQSEAERSAHWALAARVALAAAPTPCWKHDSRRYWTVENDQAWRGFEPHLARLEQLATSPIAAPHEFKLLMVNGYASVGKTTAAAERSEKLVAETSASGSNLPAPVHLEALEAFAYLKALIGLKQVAREAFQRLRALRAAQDGEDHPLTLRALHNVALLTLPLSAGETLMREAIERRTHALGEAHYDTITGIHDLGYLLLDDDGRLEEAERLLLRAIKWNEKNLDPASPDVRNAKRNLIRALRRRGEFRKATQAQRDLLRSTELAIGPHHLECFRLKHDLGLFLWNEGQREESLAVTREVVEGYKTYLPPDHRDMLTAMHDLGVLMEQTNPANDESIALLMAALEGYDRTLSPDSEDTLRAVTNLIWALQRRGDTAGAEPLLRRLVESKMRTHGPEDFETLNAKLQHATALGRLNPAQGELEHTTEAIVRTMRAKGDSFNEQVVMDLNNSALLLRNAGRFAAAEALLREALTAERRHYAADHPKLPHRMNNLTVVLAMQGKYDEAGRLNHDAYELNAVNPDVTTARILYVRLMLRLLEGRPIAETIALMRPLLAQPALAAKSNIALRWDFRDALDLLAPKLTPDQLKFLHTLLEVLNDHALRDQLDPFALWREPQAS
jgi:tetratricopeptide (TPR) repeat protein